MGITGPPNARYRVGEPMPMLHITDSTPASKPLAGYRAQGRSCAGCDRNIVASLDDNCDRGESRARPVRRVRRGGSGEWGNVRSASEFGMSRAAGAGEGKEAAGFPNALCRVWGPFMAGRRKRPAISGGGTCLTEGAAFERARRRRLLVGGSSSFRPRKSSGPVEDGGRLGTRLRAWMGVPSRPLNRLFDRRRVFRGLGGIALCPPCSALPAGSLPSGTSPHLCVFA
jgi:hypothetical protein